MSRLLRTLAFGSALLLGFLAPMTSHASDRASSALGGGYSGVSSGYKDSDRVDRKEARDAARTPAYKPWPLFNYGNTQVGNMGEMLDRVKNHVFGNEENTNDENTNESETSNDDSDN